MKIFIKISCLLFIMHANISVAQESELQMKEKIPSASKCARISDRLVAKCFDLEDKPVTQCGQKGIKCVDSSLLNLTHENNNKKIKP